MSDAEEVYTLDRAKEDIETLKDSNKEIKKKLKDCKKTVANLEETVDTLGTVQEENKQIKKKIKSVEKDIDQLKKEMHRFLPKKIPIAIDPEPLQAVETNEREFKLNDDNIRNYSASEFIKNEFLTSKSFAKVNRDLIEFIVAAVAFFLQKEHVKEVDWTVTTSDKGKSKYKEFPAEFIQDIAYLGMIGSGKNLEKRHWSNDENIEYNRAISQACSRLQTRLNKKRSDANIAAKRRRLEQED